MGIKHFIMISITTSFIYFRVMLAPITYLKTSWNLL